MVRRSRLKVAGALLLLVWVAVAVVSQAGPVSTQQYDVPLHAHAATTSNVRAHDGGEVVSGSGEVSIALSDAKAVSATRLIVVSGFAVAANTADRVVIGKLDDITAPGALAPGERTLLPQLSEDLGSRHANWAQNERVLLQEMETGNPIRDGSVNPLTGAFEGDAGFLYRERTVLSLNGWQYDPATHLWSPGG